MGTSSCNYKAQCFYPKFATPSFPPTQLAGWFMKSDLSPLLSHATTDITPTATIRSQSSGRLESYEGKHDQVAIRNSFDTKPTDRWTQRAAVRRNIRR
jgi:hypothetical protein